MRSFLAVILFAANAWAFSGWEIKDPANAQKFLELYLAREKFQREENLAGYFGMTPKFLEMKMRNHASSVKWDDKALGASLHRMAEKEDSLASATVEGFKQEGITAAAIIKRKTDEPGSLFVQLFYYEGNAWKVGDARMYMKGPFETELQKIEFLKVLPAASVAVGEVAVTGQYNIGIMEKGMDLTWTVNGVSQSPANSKEMTSFSGVVQGGLKKGKNTIVVTISKLSGAAVDPKVSVEIRSPTKSFDDYKNVKPFLNWNINTLGKFTKEFDAL